MNRCKICLLGMKNIPVNIRTKYFNIYAVYFVHTMYVFTNVLVSNIGYFCNSINWRPFIVDTHCGMRIEALTEVLVKKRVCNNTFTPDYYQYLRTFRGCVAPSSSSSFWTTSQINYYTLSKHQQLLTYQ
jgi:hypothetical protein